MFTYEGWFSEAPQNYPAPNCQWFSEVKIKMPNSFDLIITKKYKTWQDSHLILSAQSLLSHKK